MFRAHNSMNGSSTFMPCLADDPQYLMLWLYAHFFTQSWFTARGRSILFPTRTILAPSALLTHTGYHLFMRLSKLPGLVSSKTSRIPWQPLKQVSTMDLKRYCPAVSQMQSLMSSLSYVTFFILKSMVVTVASLKPRNSPSVYFQKRLDLPTQESPTMISLSLFSSPSNRILSFIFYVVLAITGVVASSCLSHLQPFTRTINCPFSHTIDTMDQNHSHPCSALSCRKCENNHTTCSCLTVSTTNLKNNLGWQWINLFSMCFVVVLWITMLVWPRPKWEPMRRLSKVMVKFGPLMLLTSSIRVSTTRLELLLEEECLGAANSLQITFYVSAAMESKYLSLKSWIYLICFRTPKSMISKTLKSFLDLLTSKPRESVSLISDVLAIPLMSDIRLISSTNQAKFQLLSNYVARVQISGCRFSFSSKQGIQRPMGWKNPLKTE